MPGNQVEVEVDIEDALHTVHKLRDAVPDAGEEAVDQLVILAEGAMKEQAPEGAGRQDHLRDTIRGVSSDDGLKATVRPHKRTRDGIPLVDIIVDGADWDKEQPPPLAPLQEWTGAKWGEPTIQAAAILRNHLVEEGTDPNPFVAESVEQWEGQVERVAGRAVAEELTGRL